MMCTESKDHCVILQTIFQIGMATPVSVSFHTLGCKLNYAETSTIKQRLEDHGHIVKPFDEGADIAIINTCSVTDFADRKCRKSVRAALRNNPETKVIVIGCYAQLKPSDIAEIEGVDLVLGAGEKFKILDYIDGLEKMPGKGWIKAGDISQVQQFEPAFSFGDRTRSFLKVQDGCNYNCSFCTIPLARGSSRSASLKLILQQVDELAGLGVKEIVLTGVNIGDFRIIDGAKKKQLIDLLDILDSHEAIERFRISSIEPNLCSDEIIDFIAGAKRFVPHFHMPLQSGNDKQLMMMRRRYLSHLYQNRVARIKMAMPHACIGADIIVGFPGETKNDFESSFQFIQSLPVSYLHVFTYSERPNTLAETLADPVPVDERRRRNKCLRQLSREKQLKFISEHLGTIRQVLLEKSPNEKTMRGFTDNYIKVELDDVSYPINSLLPVQLEKVQADQLWVSGSVRSELPV